MITSNTVGNMDTSVTEIGTVIYLVTVFNSVSNGKKLFNFFVLFQVSFYLYSFAVKAIGSGAMLMFAIYEMHMNAAYANRCGSCCA